MKLNEKGLKSFADQMLDIASGLNEKEVEWDRDFAMRQIEFESDDFQGAVVLTVEEAKQVQQEFLDIVCEIVRVLGHYGVKYAKPASLIMLEERIEQAERCDE